MTRDEMQALIDSLPEDEAREVREKARALIDAVRPLMDRAERRERSH